MDSAQADHVANRSSHWGFAAVILVAFLVADRLHEILSFIEAYRQLRGEVPFYVRSGGRNLLQIVICLVVVRLFWAGNVLESLRELGFNRRLLQGLVFGIAATSPMFIGFALTSQIASPPVSIATAYLAGVSPLTEEILYRGFACGLLFTHGRLPAWAAIGLPGVIFGWGHADLSAPVLEAISLFLLTGFFGVALGWFFLRWRQNIWVPLATHVFGNLSWEMFDVADNALGGWYPFALQLAMVSLGVVFTLRWTDAIRPIRLPVGEPERVP